MMQKVKSGDRILPYAFCTFQTLGLGFANGNVELLQNHNRMLTSD